MKMNKDLLEILGTEVTDPVSSSHTHVSLYGPYARWIVPPEKQNDFWVRYCDSVRIDKEVRNICLAETPQYVMPQIAKIILRFQADTEDNNHKPYNDDFLQSLCGTYQTVLSEYFYIKTETQIELIVVVLESSTHWYEINGDNGEKVIATEIRLQFPYANIDTDIQTRIIRPRVIELLRHNNVMSKLRLRPIGDWEDLISPTNVYEPVTMYGSNEKYDHPKLELTHIWFNIANKMLNPRIQPKEISLEDVFIPHNHIHMYNQELGTSIFDNDLPLRHWLPLFLSLGYFPSTLTPKQKEQMPLSGFSELKEISV